MKIAIIAENFAESSLCLAKYLAKNNCSVDYYKVSGITANGMDQGFEYDKVGRIFFCLKKVSFRDIPEMGSYFKNLPVRINLIRYKMYRFIPYLRDYAFSTIVNYIKRENYNFINLVGGDTMVNFHNALNGLNLIHSLHEVGSHQDGIKSSLLTDVIIRDRTPVLFFSRSTQQRFFSIEGSQNCFSSVIHFGKFETFLLYDKKTRINTGLDSLKTTFLFFGYLRPYKGLDVLAEAMKILASESSRFNLIIGGRGEDPQISFFKTLSNCFVINKVLTNSELIALAKMSDVVVMPYKSASQTGIAPIAFLFGKPIVASNVGALPEVIQNDINGMLVPPNNPQKLADAILCLVNNPAKIGKLSEGTRRFGVGDNYDWNMIAQQTIDFMHSAYSHKVN